MSPQPPVIIIGAARSGTKLLRRLVAAHASHAEIPYDINYVWRFGLMNREHDALEPEELRPDIATFVRRFFARFGDPATETIVEKTVSNCLRVPYVRAVFPNARFIWIKRDGRDVTASAMKQWQASPRWGDLLPKMKTFPWWPARRYAVGYVGNYLRRMVDGREAVRSWGPVYPGLADDIATNGLAVVCARQWRISNEYAREGLSDLPASQRHELTYEDLVRDPVAVMAGVTRFLDVPTPDDPGTVFSRDVRAGSVGKWKTAFDAADLAGIEPELAPALADLGYD